MRTAPQAYGIPDAGERSLSSLCNLETSLRASLGQRHKEWDDFEKSSSMILSSIICPVPGNWNLVPLPARKSGGLWGSHEALLLGCILEVRRAGNSEASRLKWLVRAMIAANSVSAEDVEPIAKNPSRSSQLLLLWR